MRNGSTVAGELRQRASTGNWSQGLKRLAAGVAREWNCSPGSGMAILVAPLLIALSGVAAALVGKGFYKWYTEEDGFCEDMQVAFYVAALVLSLIIVRRLWNSGEKGIAGLYLLVCVGLFFLIGEEISWGQRIFGWATPEAFQTANKQDETNLHNIYGVGSKFKWIQMLVGAYGVFLPLLVLRARGLARYREKLALLVPPYSLISYFFFMFVWRAYRNAVPEPPHRFYYVITNYNEVVELILAVGFFLFMAYQLRRIRARQTASMIDAAGISAV